MESKSDKNEKSALYGANDSIRPSILIRIAFSNLFYKKLRTTLTVIGVVVGIGAVVFLLAFGYGLRDLVTRQVVDSNSIRTIDISQANPAILSLDTDTEQKIKAFNDVESVSRVFSYAGKVDYSNAKTGVVVFGTDQQYMDLNSFSLVAGPNTSLKSDQNVIPNSSFLKAIGVKDPQKILNKKLDLVIQVPKELRPEGMDSDISVSLTVSSVVDSGSGSELYLSSKIFTDRRLDTASQAKILVSNKNAVSNLQKRIASLGFTTSSPYDTVEQIDSVFGVLNYIFLGFGGIGLIIAVLGMFNTLTITLLERTKEIGLMRTLGARKKDIRRLFILESMGLSFMGGVFGVVAAYVFSFGVDKFLNSLANSRGLGEEISVFSFKTSLVLEVIFFSAMLGLLVVYMPARRAAKMSAIEALRG
ncbi:MAG: FtsX-like permease family protein [Acidimicrobiia bacterium]